MECKESDGSDGRQVDKFSPEFVCKENTSQLDVPKSPGLKEQQTSISICWRFYRHRGVVFVLIAAFCSALHSVLIRYVKDDLHTLQISFTRFLLQFLFPVPVLTYSGISIKPESKSEFVMMIVRGVVGMTALTLLFFAFQYTSIGSGTAILFGSPAFVGIFGRIFLKEVFGIIDVVLVVVVIAGVFLISQPPFLFGGVEGEGTSTEFIGALLAFGACICVSLTTVLLGKMGKLHINSFKIVLYYAVVASVGTSLLTTIFQVWSMPSCGVVRYALVSMGILNAVTQCLITYSLSLERSIFVAILRTNEVIFAFLLEFLLFGITPSVIPLVGVGLVLSGSILTSLKKMWLSRKKGMAKRRQSELSNRIMMEVN